MARVSRVVQVPLALLVAWTSIDLCHVPPSDVPSSRPTNYLMIGNPGTGKSTILNCLLGREAFQSGVSYGSGMTYQLDVVEEGPHKYMDTPGLSDVNLRQRAADAITEALKQNGYYKIFFVVGLQNGRVRPEDIATMNLVLDAAPITKYGVIINQLTERQHSDLSSGGNATGQVISAFWGALNGKTCRHFHFMKVDKELEDAENVWKDLPEDMMEFIEKSPGIEIKSQEVKQVRTADYEEQREESELRLMQLTEQKKLELLKQILANQQWEHLGRMVQAVLTYLANSQGPKKPKW